jgi:hypothetical protein
VAGTGKWLAAIAGAFVIAAAGCSPDEPAGSRPTQRASPAPSASPLVDGDPCPETETSSPVPSGRGCLSQASGDFDGDGSRDSFTVYASLDATRHPTSWHAVVTRADDRTVEQILRVGSPFSYPVVLGAADADGDGRDEAFVKTRTHLYHSGLTHDVGMFILDGSRVVQVRADGRPLNFEVGGVSYLGHGAECRDVDFDGAPEFLLLRVDDVFGDVQKWTERVYKWRNRGLAFEKETRGRFAKTSYSDPLLRRFYELNCFSFDPPFPY